MERENLDAPSFNLFKHTGWANMSHVKLCPSIFSPGVIEKQNKNPPKIAHADREAAVACTQ